MIFLTNHIGRRNKLVMATIVAGLLALGLVLFLESASSPVANGDYAPFASEQEYQAFYKAHPLLSQQAPEGANFSYKSSVTTAKQPFYQIYLRTLQVKPNVPGSGQAYITALKSFKAEAKKWFSQNGEDLAKAYVQWMPDPASLGVTPTTPPMPPAFTPTPTPSGPQFPK